MGPETVGRRPLIRRVGLSLYVGSRVWGFLYPTKQLRLVTYSVSALAARCGAFSTLL